MRTIKSFNPIILIILAALALLAVACSPSAEKLNEEGNDAFAEEAYLEALAAYQEAQIENPELAEPYYNAANALYRQGAYPEALELMQQALSFAEDQTLAENSFYNMGNSSYNSQDWQAAVDAYTKALLLNPDDQDAKYNLELALQQLQQQQQQDQEQQEEQENQEEQQDQESSGQEGEDEQEQQDQSEGEGEEQDQEGEDENQDQGSDEQQPQDQEGEEEQEQQNGQGQPQDEGDQEGEPQPGQMPPPGQRMTEEQARQLLAAIAQDSETLQERLGQIFVVPPFPPVQDW